MCDSIARLQRLALPETFSVIEAPMAKISVGFLYAIEIDKFQLLWTVFGKVSGISEISLSEFPLHVLNIF